MEYLDLNMEFNAKKEKLLIWLLKCYKIRTLKILTFIRGSRMKKLGLFLAVMLVVSIVFAAQIHLRQIINNVTSITSNNNQGNQDSTRQLTNQDNTVIIFYHINHGVIDFEKNDAINFDSEIVNLKLGQKLVIKPDDDVIKSKIQVFEESLLQKIV
jgi:hypothetical protein